MNRRQLDSKVNEWIARNVRAVEVGRWFDRVSISTNDFRYYELQKWGELIELASAPVSGEVCTEALRKLALIAHRTYQDSGVVESWYDNGVVTRVRFADGRYEEA